MPLLAFDTETTGLPDWHQPSDSPQQPHLVQLAMILLDDNLVEKASVSVIIRPDGWVIPEEGPAAVHGITNAMANAVGISEKTAADLYVQLLYGTGATGVAHNIDFDFRIMRIAMLRAGYDKEWQEANKTQGFCTMRKTINILNLPPTPKMVAAGFNKPKQPKLSECIQFFFNEELVGAHDALVDVRACVRVYRHLMTETVVEHVGDVI